MVFERSRLVDCPRCNTRYNQISEKSRCYYCELTYKQAADCVKHEKENKQLI